MRVLMFADYRHAAQHRKVELLADAADLELVHIVGPQSGRAPGRQPSASGRRAYATRLAPRAVSLGVADDPHRSFGWPPRYGLRRFKPHVIHYEGEVESLGAAEIVLLRQVLARAAALTLTSWQNILRPRRAAVRFISAFNLRAAEHVFCASREAIDVLRQEGYRGGASVCPIAGLDTRYFSPQRNHALRAALGLDGFVVGYAGRLVPEKGIDTLLAAVAQVPAALRVLVIGDGPERSRLECLAGQLGIGDRCRFVGAVPYDRAGEYMNTLDLLVLPSQSTAHWKEQFGRVLVEAMGCRVAVAGSDSGAIPEVIGDPERIFPEGNAAALAVILARLAGNDALRDALAERDRRHALQHYAVEQLAAKTLEVWRDLYARRRPLSEAAADRSQ